MKPKVRDVEAHVVTQTGQQGILLRDPLRLADRALFLPMALAPLLELCDGTRDESALRASLAVRAGVQIGPAMLQQVLEQLDEALLLDNDRFSEAYWAALREYRTATLRPPVSAGQSYPAEPQELKEALRSYVERAGQVEQPSPGAGGTVRGLVSPHIDYERGGVTYAGVWQRAADAVREAELAIIFGTDHIGGARLTLTHQRYATPLGVLPTANAIVDQVAGALGPDEVFGAELHHRTEHSIELAAVWLQYMLGGRECQLLPVLCGGFEALMDADGSPAEQTELKTTLDLLKEAGASHRTIIIAAGDLAHVGPAFGDRHGIDIFEKVRLKLADEELMASICAGDEEAFWRQVRDERDRRRICGLSPIYMALSMLGETEGLVTGYAQCPADQEGLSYVSICGIVLS
ncbi:MAG TPA: AmmeMemoRadiSam system protein B [Anaerolineae bacterium]|nr:AmmeMemoRadiSam system protein B [Anaerolineae bacterium]